MTDKSEDITKEEIELLNVVRENAEKNICKYCGSCGGGGR
jgi:hypothetical protein